MNQTQGGGFTRLVDPSQKGLGGFLLVLWLSVTVLRPGFTLWYVITTITTAHPEAFVLGWKVVTVPINLAFAALGVYAGVLLWRLDPCGPRLAMVYFLIAIGFKLVAVLATLRYGVGYVFEALIRHPVIFLFDLGWLAYLKWSRRVRLTYGSREAPAV